MPVLARYHDRLLDAPQFAGEHLLPAGARHRQLSVRTLLVGTRFRHRCSSWTGTLPCTSPSPTAGRPPDPRAPGAARRPRRRPGPARLIADWKIGRHQLTYRQTEHTFGQVVAALGKTEPDGAPAEVLQAACDRLLEASIPAAGKTATSSLAADWTDVECWSRPPRHGSTACHDPEAHWGHRRARPERVRSHLSITNA